MKSGLFQCASTAVLLALCLFAGNAVGQSKTCDRLKRDLKDNEKQVESVSGQVVRIGDLIEILETGKAGEMKDEIAGVEYRIQNLTKKMAAGENSAAIAAELAIAQNSLELLKMRSAKGANNAAFFDQPKFKDMERQLNGLKSQETDLKVKIAELKTALVTKKCSMSQQADDDIDGISADLEDKPATEKPAAGVLGGTWVATLPSSDCVMTYTLVLVPTGKDNWSSALTAGGNCAGQVDRGSVGNVTLTITGAGKLSGSYMGQPIKATYTSSQIVMPLLWGEMIFKKK
jgi:hypothetical protein